MEGLVQVIDFLSLIFPYVSNNSLEFFCKDMLPSVFNKDIIFCRYLTWFPNVNESSAIAEIHEYMEDFQDNCIYQSVLRIWTQNGTMDPIYKLDQHEIIRAVSNAINGVRYFHYYYVLLE